MILHLETSLNIHIDIKENVNTRVKSSRFYMLFWMIFCNDRVIAIPSRIINVNLNIAMHMCIYQCTVRIAKSIISNKTASFNTKLIGNTNKTSGAYLHHTNLTIFVES